MGLVTTAAAASIEVSGPRASACVFQDQGIQLLASILQAA
jgi:hypothetical protein